MLIVRWRPASYLPCQQMGVRSSPKRLFARGWNGSFEFLVIKVDVTWGRRLFLACNAGVGHDRGVLDTVYAA